jgi:hypothetical protein
MAFSPARVLMLIPLTLAACSGSRSDSTDSLSSQDASTEREDARTEPDDAQPTDAAEGPADGGPRQDGEPDAAADAAAAEDASTDDAAAPDAATPEAFVYASFGTMLVRISPDSGELREVGRLRNAADEAQSYVDVVMSWTGTDNTAWLITSYYQTPTLARVDLCTGLVTLGPVLSRAASPNLTVEGLAVHPDGTVYMGSGNPANPALSPISTNLGTVNTTTGVITDLGTTTVTSAQNDIDGLFFRGEVLYGVDVATVNSRLDLYTFDLSTGAETDAASPSYGASTAVPLRIAHDDTRGKTFAWRPGDRNLVELDLATGAATALGETHAAATYDAAPSRGFTVAAVDCLNAQD